jgi:hypothetical protein
VGGRGGRGGAAGPCLVDAVVKGPRSTKAPHHEDLVAPSTRADARGDVLTSPDNILYLGEVGPILLPRSSAAVGGGAGAAFASPPVRFAPPPKHNQLTTGDGGIPGAPAPLKSFSAWARHQKMRQRNNNKSHAPLGIRLNSVVLAFLVMGGNGW